MITRNKIKLSRFKIKQNKNLIPIKRLSNNNIRIIIRNKINLSRFKIQ